MTHAHFVITRFCYRNHHHNRDPLKHRNLKRRLQLLKLGSRAAISNQSDQDFCWIILIDKMLPRQFRSPLEEIVDQRRGSHLVEFESNDKIRGLQWLEPWLAGETRFVTTTVLDDDDLLYRDFIADLRSLARRQSCQTDLFLSGCRHADQWDLLRHRDAPFGYLKPWTRRNQASAFPVSAGFSLTSCRDMDTSVLAFDHASGPFYFGASRRSELLTASRQQELQKRLGMNLAQIQQWANAERFQWLESDTNPQALMVNHFGNLQVSRLFEDLEKRRAISSLDWLIEQFGVNPRDLETCLQYERPNARNLLNTVSSSITLARRAPAPKRLKLAWRFSRHNIAGFWRCMRS